jgi:transketolase
MPISATTEKNSTKQNKQDVISSVSFGDCDSSESECAYKYSSDSSDSSDSFEYRRQKIKTSVKSEANITNKTGGYFLSDSDSDSSEYRRHKTKPSVSLMNHNRQN